MQKLVLLYWGCVFLMYLSQLYYPVETRLDGRQSGARSFMWRRADLFMVIVIAWMTCFSFLRTSYNDTYNYRVMFDNAITLREFIEEKGLLKLGGNHLSYMYQSWMHDLTDNYHIYFFVPAFLSSLAVVKFFKQYSVNPAISLLIFFSIGTYIMYVAALKQCFAMFFLLLAVPYLEKKQYVKFYALVLLAMTFHTHAFMFLICPFLCGKPWGKRMWILLLAALFAIATYDSTLAVFMEYAEKIGAFVAEEEVFDGHSINEIRVMVYFVPGLLALVFRRRLFSNSTQTENLIVNLSCVSAFILMIGLVEGANLYARMAAYFEIFSALALPWMIGKLFEKQSAKFVGVVVAALYFGYFYYEFAVSKSFGTAYASISLWEFIKSLFG